MPTTTTILVRNFSGKILPFEVNLDDKVGDIKWQVAKTTLRAGAGLEPVLKFNGHELRDHRKISYYGIEENSLVHVLPPRKPDEMLLKLNCVAFGKPFTIEVSPKISVNQLKKDIEIEEKIEVYSLSYSTSEPGEEVEDDWDVIPAEESYPLEPHDAAMHSFPFSTCSDYTIHVLPPPPPAIPPETFPMTIALYDDGTERKLPFDARLQMTLREFREGVKERHGMSIDQDVLILVGKELTREDSEDIPIWDLGFLPGCTVHSVPYLAFTVEAPNQKIFETMLLHPLTKLTNIRKLLEEQQCTSDEEDMIPLDRYGFTLDGREHLKEWRSLWGLGLFSGSTVYLRPRTISLNISSLTNEFQMDVEENDTIADVKEQYRLVSGSGGEGNSDLKLLYRRKLLRDEKTVKEEGLVGGETLRCSSWRNLRWGEPSTSSATTDYQSTNAEEELGEEFRGIVDGNSEDYKSDVVETTKEELLDGDS